MAEADRRRVLVEAAESVFLTLGYNAAGTSDIARRAGMSKKTLYRLFGSKEDLFSAVIAARCESSGTQEIASSSCESLADIETALKKYLGRLTRFILAPRQIALYRLVIAEARRSPELSRAFYREGPTKARAALAEWLKSQIARGLLRIAHPESAATMLISMALSELHMRLLLGDSAPDTGAIDRRVDSAVALFLYGAVPAVSRHKKAGQERG